MVSVSGGPIGLTVLALLWMGAGAVVLWGSLNLRARWARRGDAGKQREAWAQHIEASVGEAKRLLSEDARAVNVFVSEFGAELAHEFGDQDWVRSVTLHDLRSHAEVAVFNLIQGCPCGQCSGVSNHEHFWVEASREQGGIVLEGYMKVFAVGAKVGCNPSPLSILKKRREEALKTSVPPNQNVEMVCDCGTPVVTSIDHLAEGKKPKCAICVTGKPRA